MMSSRKMKRLMEGSEKVSVLEAEDTVHGPERKRGGSQ
jgi:hypothetical protein